ncbi:MAG: fluoride efflux transporter FluC [Propionibacteriaceae bacterium]
MLPVDSDVEAGEDAAGVAKPVHLYWRNIGWVALGGAVGTGARYLIGEAVPPMAGIPVTTFAINVLGAFLLGAVLEGLALRGKDAGRRRTARLLVGTGALGGFTTYSTLANDTVVLLAVAPVHAVGYALLTVVAGAAASLAGIALMRRLGPRPGGSSAR